MDQNVHFCSTISFADALIKANKDFDMPKPEDRRQMTEKRRQKTEDGRQKTALVRYPSSVLRRLSSVLRPPVENRRIGIR
jgi:hypothetical protein